MSNIILNSIIKNDEYTNYVYEKYDIQNRENVETVVPMIDLSEIEDDSFILLLLGNSGSGKSTILRSLGYTDEPIEYDYSKSIISQFPNKTPEEVCELLNAIGLSSVPTWLKKPNEISNGQKARLDIAMRLNQVGKDGIVFLDEYTSVVNRETAKSMSFSLQRYVRKYKLKLFIASCHYDIIEWIKSDYIFDLNQQENGECELQKMIYSDDEEYKNYKMIEEIDILSDAKEIQ